MKKMLALLMAALMLLSAIPALAEEEVPAEEVELTFFCGNGDVKFNEVVETLITGFEKEQEGKRDGTGGYRDSGSRSGRRVRGDHGEDSKQDGSAAGKPAAERKDGEGA